MKRAALLYLLGIFSLLGLMTVVPVFAENSVDISNNGEGSHTSVDVQSNTGNNTICTNGKCTTSQGSNGTSHVCINGKCYDSTGGNMHVQSDDGHAQVTINNNTDNPSTTEEPSSTVNISTSISQIPTPDVSKILEKHKKDIEKQKQQIAAHIAQHKALLQQLIDTLSNFFKSFHW